MKIEHEVRVEQKVVNEKQQKERISFKSRGRRSNNRKNTRGRYTQAIHCLDNSQWPPVMYTKFIKHLK